MARKSLIDIVQADSLKDGHPKIEVLGPLSWGFYDTISVKNDHTQKFQERARWVKPRQIQ
jgi:hypothetical protein